MRRTVIRPGITATNWSASVYPQIQHGLRADAVEYVRPGCAIWLTIDLDARRGQSVVRQTVVFVHRPTQGARGRRRDSVPRPLDPARQARGHHLAPHSDPRELVRRRSATALTRQDAACPAVHSERHARHRSRPAHIRRIGIAWRGPARAPDGRLGLWLGRADARVFFGCGHAQPAGQRAGGRPVGGRAAPEARFGESRSARSLGLDHARAAG